MTKRQLECAGIAIYGWCDLCRDRTGQKHYRLLIGGSCNDCNRKYKYKKNDTTSLVRDSQSATKPARIGRRGKKEKTVEPRPFTRPPESQLREEEALFLAKLHESHLYDSDWVNPMAIALGWTYEKTRNVGRRLRRKGHTVPLGTTSDRLLQLIKQHPWISFEELMRLISNISADWLNNLLFKAVESENLIVLENSNPNLCRYRTAMNFLIFATRSDCICAYSQMWRCYGIFIDNRDPEVFAALRLKCPAIVGEKADFFKYWVSAHSTIVGRGEGVEATTDVLSGFSKGETPVQDCLNEVESKRQLFIENDARKTVFAPGGF